MVREKRAARRHVRRRSIWDTPRIRRMLAEPVGSPIDLTREEAEAIIRHAIEHPPTLDKDALARTHRELRRLRRESGALFVRPDKDD